MQKRPLEKLKKMLLINNNIAFFHIPKCGGNYVRDVIKAIGVESEEIGDPHCCPYEVDKCWQTSFCVVRDPLGWYQSYYRYRVHKKWRPGHHLDDVATAKNFEKFVNRVIDAYPFGYLSMYMNRYIPYVDEILHTSNLTAELKAYFAKVGLSFPPHDRFKRAINSTPQNINTDIKPQTLKRLLRAEKGLKRIWKLRS